MTDDKAGQQPILSKKDFGSNPKDATVEQAPAPSPAKTPRLVLFLTRKWPPAVGGMETYCIEITAGLRALGFDVEVQALPGRPDGSAPGKGAMIAFGLRQAARHLTSRHPAAVVFGGDLAVWPLVWAACVRSKAQPVIAAHGSDISLAGRSDLRGRLYAAYLGLGRHMMPDLTVIANSEATATRVREQSFAAVTTVPLGCRVNVNAPDPELGRSLLFAGRLVTRKGLSWFVDKVLSKLSPDVRLAVAGTRWDANEDRALKHPRVDFLGALPQPELHRKMAGALAVVIPNISAGDHQFEGFGLIAAEAAASGALVLASRLDGYTSSVIEGETGTLLPPGDAPAWISAIKAIQALSEQEKDARRARAREAAQKNFDWSRTSELTAATFR